MIRDEELKSSTDYSQGQTEAAHRVLVTFLVTLTLIEDLRISFLTVFQRFGGSGSDPVTPMNKRTVFVDFSVNNGSFCFA